MLISMSHGEIDATSNPPGFASAATRGSDIIHIASIPSTQQIITKPDSKAVWNPVEAFDSACHKVPVALAAAELGDPKLENHDNAFEPAFPNH